MTEPIVFNGVTIAEVCRYCGGGGKVILTRLETCGFCSGKGTVETPDGEALRLFIQRHVSVQVTIGTR